MIKLLYLICAVLPEVDHKPEPVEIRQVCPYGSVSFSPGPGVSVRNRTGSQGDARDFGMGFGNKFFSSAPYTRLSFDYNWMWFSSKTKHNSLYCSYGVGGQIEAELLGDLPWVYIPLRAGYQVKYGFVDVGVNMFYGIFPTPEARIGFSFEY